MMDKGIYYHQHDDQLTVKLVGELRFHDGKPLALMVDSLDKESGIGELSVDLQDTEYLDSTMLGVIGKLGFIYLEKGKAKPVIYCQENDVRKMLDTMGLEKIFNIENIKISNENLEILRMTADSFNMRNHVIQAHETLSKIQPANREEFEDLLHKLKAKDNKPDE